MNLGRLSINQPILAMVLSIVLLIVGAIAYTTLPISEYPQVVPPTVVVTTQYPGASAQTVSDTVAAPIEQEINGVVTRKNSPDILMVVFMLSPDDSFDQLYISNYALLQVRDELLRLDGIGDIQMFGARDYSMRLWLDPERIAASTSPEVMPSVAILSGSSHSRIE